MSAIIKRHQLPTNRTQGEYIIDPDKNDSPQPEEQQAKKLSPQEEAAIIVEQAHRTAAEIIDKTNREVD